MTLPRCETSYGAQHGECAVWLNDDTLCDRPLGHLAGDLPHRGHDPNGSGRWVPRTTTVDNPLDQGLTDLREHLRVSPDAETPNRVPHVHHYVLKGSGLSCYAECAVVTSLHVLPSGNTLVFMRCGEKLAGAGGPIVGSRAKIEAAIRAA